jgi:hypothetical protein
MISLEEQIHRWAVDIAGPPVREVQPESPRDTHGKGRWLLVAALLVFTVGVGYVVLDASRPTSTPSTASTVPEPTAYGADAGTCPDGTPGVAVEGPDGGGICLGVQRAADGSMQVVQQVAGLTVGVWSYGSCEPVSSPIGVRTSGPTVGEDGRLAVFWLLPDAVDRLLVTGGDGTETIVQTFALPGLDHGRVAAAWLGESASSAGSSLELLEADGAPYLDPAGTTPTGGCPN